MPITFHESSKVFHLSNKDFSYIFCVLGGGQLGQLYYGAPLRDRDDFDHMLTTGGAVLVASPYEDQPDFGMEDVKQEYPVHGNGDLRPMACTITAGNGSTDALFTYVSHVITPGKPTLEGLPATYVEDASEAETLSITLHDEVLGADMVLSYTVYEGLPVLARSARIVNTGDTTFTIDSAMSINLDLPDADYDMMEFTGAWARERRPRRQALHPGTQSIYLDLAGAAARHRVAPGDAEHLQHARPFQSPVQSLPRARSSRRRRRLGRRDWREPCVQRQLPGAGRR